MSKSLTCLFVLLALLFGGCASAGDGFNRGDDDVSGSGSGNPTGFQLLEFQITVNPNGQIDRTGRGIYAILFNAQGTPIEVTDLDTFTDMIRFDGVNFDWYHRLAEVPNPGFTFTQVGTLSGQATVTPDGKTIQIVLDTADSTSFVNQFLPTNLFTAHVVTTDASNSAFLGRLIDTLGQGPNIDSNSLQTVTVQRGLGVSDPVPQSYPFDPLNDEVVHPDLGDDFPYANFDIVRFEVTAR